LFWIVVDVMVEVAAMVADGLGLYGDYDGP
jgi:hypothetical protein